MKQIAGLLVLIFTFSSVGNAQNKKEQDKEAIKKMCGCFEVTFNFAETFSYSEDSLYKPSKTKIHKIYVLPETQGLGLGKLLFEKVREEAIKANQEAIFLNVNKYNNAQHFYTKLNFEIVKEEVIDIGRGYVMDDYVMEVKL